MAADAPDLKLTAVAKDDGVIKFLDVFIAKSAEAATAFEASMAKIQAVEVNGSKTVLSTVTATEEKKATIRKSSAETTAEIDSVEIRKREIMYAAMFDKLEAQEARAAAVAEKIKINSDRKIQVEADRAAAAIERTKVIADKKLQIEAERNAQINLRIQKETDLKWARGIENLHARWQAIADVNYKYEQIKYAGHTETLLAIQKKYAIESEAIAARATAAIGPSALSRRIAEGINLAGGGRALHEATATASVLGLEKEGTFLGMSGNVALGVAAGVGILAFSLEHLARKAEEFRKADEALNISLEISGKEAQVSRASLELFAETIGKTTKFTRQQAQIAESSLLSFSRVAGGQIESLLKLSADLAAAPGLRFEGIEDAARKVGLAMEEPEKGAKALKSANVVLTVSEMEKIKAWEESGQRAKAQVYIYDLLVARSKDFAEKTKHNTDEVSHSWDELSGKVGLYVIALKEAAAAELLEVGNAGKLQGEQERLHHARMRLARDPNTPSEVFHPFEYHKLLLEEAEKIKKADEYMEKVLKGTGPFVGNNADGGKTDEQTNRIEEQNQRLLDAQSEFAAASFGLRATEWQKRINQENSSYEKIKAEDKKHDIDIEIDRKAHLTRLATIDLEESEKARLKKIEDHQKLIEGEQKFNDEMEQKHLSFASREAAAADTLNSNLSSIELKRNDEKRRAELEAFDRDYRMKADAANLDLSTAANYDQYQRDRTALVRAQTEERLNDIEREGQKQVEIDNKIAHENKKIGAAYLTIGTEIANAFNVGPLQEAFAWLQRIMTVLEAIKTIEEATAAIKALSAGAGLFSVVALPLSSAGAALADTFGLGHAEQGGTVGPRKYGPGGPVIGNRHSNGGVMIEAEGGEEIISRNDVRGAGGNQSVRDRVRGGGGFTHSGPVIIQVSVPGGATHDDARRIGEAVSVGYYDGMKAQEKKSRNIPYYRAQGI